VRLKVSEWKLGAILGSLVGFPLLWAVVVWCCAFNPDANMDNNATANNLCSWAGLVTIALEKSLPVQDYSTGEELEDALRRGKFIDFVDQTSSTDAWNNPLIYKCTITHGSIEVEITSKGRNQVFENGTGDDVSLKVTKGSNMITNVIRKPTEQGVDEFSMGMPGT
jgi:hypothetical protein